MIHTDGKPTIANSRTPLTERTRESERLAQEIPSLAEYHGTQELPILSISFDSEASATFSHVVRAFSGWTVDLTLEDGTKATNVRVLDVNEQHGWYDGVSYVQLNDDGDPVGEKQYARVTNVHVY